MGATIGWIGGARHQPELFEPIDDPAQGGSIDLALVRKFGLGQTVGMWLVDRNTILRERMTKGVIDERVLYRVSPDGRTLVWTNFNAAGNSGHTVWDRIELPRR